MRQSREGAGDPSPAQLPRSGPRVYRAERAMSLRVVPITISDANELVKRWHRHHNPSPGGLFAVACAVEDKVVGAAIVGRPIARMADDGFSAEVTRVVTDGTPNACSILHGAIRRACFALGYHKIF